MVKTRVIKLRGIGSLNLPDQITVILCIPFTLSGSLNEAGHIRVLFACIITPWKLGLWAPLIRMFSA